MSRVVIGGDIFQTIIVRRDPDSVALTSPINASGLFELQAQPSEMLFPFEGNGVDTTWEFRMPRASNLFDYTTIADVLLTIDYTALDSYDYRQQVMQTLKPTLSLERPFSFRRGLPDQWWDLHNPDQTSTPMAVTFTIRREDFPPNLDGIKIQEVLVYFSRADNSTFEVPVAVLSLQEAGTPGAIGGGSISIDGLISTRKGNGSSWLPMKGKSPFGTWKLAFPDTGLMRKRFKDEEIEDILFVITFSGHTPPWPS